MCSCTRIICNTHGVKKLYLWNTHTYIKIVRCVEKNPLPTIKCLHNILVNVIAFGVVPCHVICGVSVTLKRVIVWGE